MSSFFEKLGKDLEEEILDKLILFYFRYIKSEGNINEELLEFAENLTAYDDPNIFKNIPSQVIRESLNYTINIHLNSFNNKKSEIPSIEKAKELLIKLKKERIDMK